MEKKFDKWMAEKGYQMNEDTTAEQLAGYYLEYNEVQKDELSAAIKAENKEMIEALRHEMSEEKAAQQLELNKTLSTMGVAIKKLSKQEKSEMGSFDLGKSLQENAEKLTALKSSRGSAQGITFKVPANMLLSTNVSGGNVPVEQRLEGLNVIASRQIRFLDVLTKGTASSNVISWVYQANKDGAAGGTAEGTLKNQIDFDLVVASETVKKRTAFIKVSEEMLEDVDFMQSEIRNELSRELLKDVEAQAYGGDGTGTNLNGVKTVATAFAAGSFAGAVDNANEVDVLTVAMNQIALAEKEMPNYIFMNPSDVTALKMVKVSSTDKRYVERLAMISGALSLDGVPIIPTTLVAQGEYLLGNFGMAYLYDKGAVTIEIGRDSDDFTKNLVTVLAEWRGLVLVKNNDRPAFVAGVFATDKAALETI